MLVLVVVFFTAQIDGFLNGRLFNRISSSVAIMALVATGQTLVILTRNIDLSVGSVVGFVAFAAGSMITNNPDLHPGAAGAYAALVGAGFGLINGLLVAYARVPSIIVTLATMALFRSTLVEYSDGKSITTDNLPAWLTEFPEPGAVRVRSDGVSGGVCRRRLLVVMRRASGHDQTAPRAAVVCRGVQPRGGGYGGD